MAPGWMLPIRSPITRSAPASNSLDEAGNVSEVVGQVRVRHHDVRRPAQRRNRRCKRCRTRGAARRRPALQLRGPTQRCRRQSRCPPRSPRLGSPVLERLGRLRDAALDGRRLVEAGDDHRHFDGAGLGLVGRGKASCLLGGSQRNGPWEGRLNLTNARGWTKSRPLGGDGSERSARLSASRAHLPRLRLPVPVHRRRRRALVPRPRRAPRGRGSRGHLPDPAPVGAGRGAATFPGVRVVAVRRADALYAEAAGGAIGPPLVLRRRRAAPSRCATVAPTTPCTRARSRSSRCSRRARARRPRALPARGRLVRGLDAGLLAGVPRRARRARRRAVQRLCVRCRQRAFCFSALHERRLRDEGLRGEVDGARGRVRRRLADTPEPRPRRAGRRVRRAATSPRSGRRLIPAVAALAARARPARRDLRRRARARGGRAEARRGTGSQDRVARAGIRRRRRGRRGPALGPCACCCRPSARATAWSSSRPRARGTPSVVVAAPDNAATELVDDGVNGVVAPASSAEDLAAAIRARARRRGWPCASEPALGSRPTPHGCLWRARWFA